MTKSTQLTRPTSLAELNSRFEGLTTENGRNSGLQFQPQPSDVIISPFGKSGTTWLQQIVHGLRSRGDMDFDDISRVVPWIEVSHDLGIDIHQPQAWQPRAFKSHLSWHEVPKGGRYIVSIRNPKDVLVSMYRFLEGWFFEIGSISITDYAEANFLTPDEGKGYWHHLLSWWPQRHQENVLLLSYEAMQTDLPGTIRKVARFIDIPLDEALFDLVLRQASFDFMLAHKDRFDDRLMRERSEQIGKLPPHSDSSKVRQGKVGSHADELTAALRQKLDDIWQEVVTPALGFPHYEALQAKIAELHCSTS